MCHAKCQFTNIALFSFRLFTLVRSWILLAPARQNQLAHHDQWHRIHLRTNRNENWKWCVTKLAPYEREQTTAIATVHSIAGSISRLFVCCGDQSFDRTNGCANSWTIQTVIFKSCSHPMGKVKRVEQRSGVEMLCRLVLEHQPFKTADKLVVCLSVGN